MKTWHWRSARQIRIHSLFVLMVAALGVSCGEKSKDKKTHSGPAASPVPGDKGEDKSSSAFSMTGQLQLGTLNLAATTPGVLLVKMNGKSQVEEFKELEVDASGNFRATLERKDATAEKAAAILKDGGVNRSLAKEVYPQYAAQIDSMSDEELRSGLQESIEDSSRYGGYKYMLIAYDKAGDALEQAHSMQFIGLPLADGARLRTLPGEAVTGDLNLGSIAGSGDEAKATATAEGSLTVSGSYLKELAALSQTLKVVKNDWVNRETKPANLTPWFGFRATGFDAIRNAWSDPANAAYWGSGLYMGINNIGATFGEVCPANPGNPADTSGSNYTATPAKKVEWFPPAEVTMASIVHGPNSPLTNLLGAYSRRAQYGEVSCGGDGMYARAKSDGDTAFQLQLGHDLSGVVPAGFWKLSVDSVAKGYWDISAAKPLDEDGKPVVYMPVLRAVLDDQSKITRLDIKFYFFDKAKNAFVEVSDVTGLRSTIHQLSLDGTYGSAVPHSGGDFSSNGKIADNKDGSFSVLFGDADKAVLDCNANPSAMCFKGFGFSYLIGSVSYRLEYAQ